jgi:multidrug efflux pump subunit AcrB
MAPTGNLLDFGVAVKEHNGRGRSSTAYGIEVTQIDDQSAVVEDTAHGFLKVLIEALVTVLAVSFLSLGVWAGLVVSASIPCVLALTFIGMQVSGIG